MEKSRAIAQGSIAYREGYGLEKCPYTDKWERRWWTQGWLRVAIMEVVSDLF